MIAYVISADHAYTIEKYLEQWVSADEGSFIQVVFYEEAPWRWLHLPATYIFTDIERLTADEIAAAMDYARSLQAGGYPVLNAPGTVATRLELQNRLFEQGVNPFRHWPRASFQQARFPAFLRRANTHAGSIGDLIRDSGQLADRLKALPAPERLADDLILVEFCETKDRHGRYYKYSAMRVGETIVPRHVLTSLNWMLKLPDILDAEALAIERDYVRNFPHRETLKKVFSLAGIEHGRVDYSLQDGDIRVWEINTNPTLMPNRKSLAESRRELIEETNHVFLRALQALDSDRVADGSQLKAEWDEVSVRHGRFALPHRWKRRILGGKRP